MPHMAINLLAKGDTIIIRKVDSKATLKYYAQSLKVDYTWLGFLVMTIPTKPTLLGCYSKDVTSSHNVY